MAERLHFARAIVRSRLRSDYTIAEYDGHLSEEEYSPVHVLPTLFAESLKTIASSTIHFDLDSVYSERLASLEEGTRRQFFLFRNPPHQIKRTNNNNQQFKEAESFQELRPVDRAVSEYFMDQIKLEKPTKSEIAHALTQQDQKSTSSEDALRSAQACPSEYQMTALNNELDVLNLNSPYQ
ncbi:hypothetical protein OSTOST_15529 [Ostertagia ostertagi]